MRIAYVLHARFPTPKAYGKQVAEVCAACSALKHGVTLLLPSMHNAFREEPFAYYGLPKKAFAITTLKHADATRKRWIPGKFHLVAGMFFYRRALKRHFQKHSYDLLYCRSPLVLPALLAAKIPVILELHTLPRRGKRKFLQQVKRCAKVVCLTSGMEKELLAWGMPKEKIMVEPDGVDLDRFADLPAPEECKEHWKLPSDVPVIGYAGTLVTQETIGKGVDVLIEAFAILQRRGREFFGWIVGGPEPAAQALRAQIKEKKLHYLVQLQGHIPPAKVPEALQACDVLVYPAPSSPHAYFQRDTSPLKLFEYLAAGKPIVCADLPPLRDAVGEDVATFALPGDPASLADAIDRALSDLDGARERAEAGLEHVQQFGWKKRMAKILKM